MVKKQIPKTPRPAQYKHGVTVYLNDELIAAIDRIRKAEMLPRAIILRRYIQEAVERA